MEIVNVKLSKLKPDPNQPRQKLDEERIKDMAQSIKTEGVINPIEVDSRFIIITGEMRWRAAKIAGLDIVPCKVLKIAPRERFRRQVIENIHHNTMTEWDTAKALSKLLNLPPGGNLQGKGFDLGISKLAGEIGKSQQYISEKLSLLGASASFKKALQDGLQSSFIRALIRTPDKFKKDMEKKIIAGDFQSRDQALEVAAAISRNPEKGNQILQANSITEVHKISPKASDTMKLALTPPQELANIKRQLLAWLKQYPPNKTIKINAPQTILTLDVMVRAIQDWGKKAQRL